MSRVRTLTPLAIALIISLVANALLIGLVIGGLIGKPRGGHGRGGSDYMIARGIQDIVPEGERNEIREAFHLAFEDSRADWQTKREARREFMAALSASPFSKAEIDRSFEDMRAADTALTRSFQATLSEQIAALSDAQRAELVDWLEDVEARRRERRERRRRHRGGDRDGPRGNDPPPRPR